MVGRRRGGGHDKEIYRILTEKISRFVLHGAFKKIQIVLKIVNLR